MAPRQQVRLRPRRVAGQEGPARFGADRPEGNGGGAERSLCLGRRHGEGRSTAFSVGPAGSPFRPALAAGGPGDGRLVIVAEADRGRRGASITAERTPPRSNVAPPAAVPSVAGAAADRVAPGRATSPGAGRSRWVLIGIGVFAGRLAQDVRVQARLSVPGYCYLLALNPDGKTQLCYPATKPAAAPGHGDHDRLPGRPGYGLWPDRRRRHPGVRAVASAKPLPPYARVVKARGQCPGNRPGAGRLALRRAPISRATPSAARSAPWPTCRRPWKRPAASLGWSRRRRNPGGVISGQGRGRGRNYIHTKAS